MSFFEIKCDMNALSENYLLLGKKIGDFFSVVKCNAYGHGLKSCVLALCDAGCKKFAVAQPSEAVLIRELSPSAEILLLSRADRCEISELFEKDIILTVFSREYAKEIAPFVEKSSRLHLKIETSMNRCGLLPNEIPSDFFGFSNNISGIYTHLPRAFDKAETQKTVESFAEISKAAERKLGRNILKHCAASQAALEIPSSRLDLSRIGIALYGAYPNEMLTPVMTAKSKVVALHTAKKGELVGYGRDFLCHRDTVVATVCGGYADGLLRSGKNRLTALINGQLAKVCGAPCMDRTMFDVTPIFDIGEKVSVGDEALFFGADKNVIETARECQTIPYEILTSVGGKA